jgi:predicted ATPase with chaperone activity
VRRSVWHWPYLPEESGRGDLPIALGVLAASRYIDPARLDAFEFAGGRWLGFELGPVHGTLALGLALRRTASPTPSRILVLARRSAEKTARIGGLRGPALTWRRAPTSRRHISARRFQCRRALQAQ